MGVPVTHIFVVNQRKTKMIDCKECVEDAHTVLARGEIGVEDINKLALDRHILKGYATEHTIGFWDSSKVPTDIICNGFSMKDVIVEILNRHHNGYVTQKYVEEIAEDIKEAFAVKLRLKQGE